MKDFFIFRCGLRMWEGRFWGRGGRIEDCLSRRVEELVWTRGVTRERRLPRDDLEARGRRSWRCWWGLWWGRGAAGGRGRFRRKEELQTFNRKQEVRVIKDVNTLLNNVHCQVQASRYQMWWVWTGLTTIGTQRFYKISFKVPLQLLDSCVAHQLHILFLINYIRLDTIYSWMEHLATRFPHLVSLKVSNVLILILSEISTGLIM